MRPHAPLCGRTKSLNICIPSTECRFLYKNLPGAAARRSSQTFRVPRRRASKNRPTAVCHPGVDQLTKQYGPPALKNISERIAGPGKPRYLLRSGGLLL
jgi:hypothetical protein